MEIFNIGKKRQERDRKTLRKPFKFNQQLKMKNRMSQFNCFIEASKSFGIGVGEGVDEGRAALDGRRKSRSALHPASESNATTKSSHQYIN